MIKDEIYLDYAATTPVDPRVVTAMQPYWSDLYGNSASIHAYGQEAAKGLESARRQVAESLGAHPTEIVFTAGGTESNNLAIRGVAWRALKLGRGRHLITSPVEHHAVSDTMAQLQDLFGFEVTRVPVDAHGRVDPRAVKKALRADTVLISIMHANNEVGTLQPIAEIGQIAREHGVPLHTDAVQTGGKQDLDVARLNVDLLSLSAHKFYGPKGVGVLYIQRDIAMTPPLTGGGHERGRRPGTVNVGGAVGLARALQLAQEEQEAETTRQARLRDQLIKGVLSRVPDVQLTGHPTQRLANNASFAFRDCDGETLLLALDLAGVAASTGSACSIGDPDPSPILSAMGLERAWGLGSLRLTLGRWTQQAEIARVLDVLPGAVEKTRKLQA